MKDGSEKFLNHLQVHVLNVYLQREKEIIESSLREIQKNNYEQQSFLSKRELDKSLHKFSA